MPETLLRTKLFVPPLRPNLVTRPHLIDRLNQGLQPGLKITLVSAPAGYGKTTALAQWARSSRSPIGWLSLGTSDNDFERFFRYLVMAWEEIQPGIIESPLGTLIDSSSPDKEALLAAFINVASELQDHTSLALDDFHLIEEPSIQDALVFLLDHLPPQLHFVLAGRGEPALPLARFRARGELLELGLDDLRFRPQEAQNLLNDMAGLALPTEEIESLQAQLEGWVAGLYLVALAHGRGRVRTGRFAVSGRQRFVADYLREEVLADLSLEMRQFLMKTSILERLCGPLCEAVTGMEDGQRMLEAIEKEGLFLTPLDDRREWFRYHSLFSELLHQELLQHIPEEVADVHRRAAQWYLANELPDLAFPHAAKGKDVELTIMIAERFFVAKVLGGELRVAQSWLNSIPAVWLSGNPIFRMFEASFLLATGQFEPCMRLLDKIEQEPQLQYEDTYSTLARATALRCYIACYQNDLVRAQAMADKALEGLPDDEVSFRPGIFQALGDTLRRNGYWKKARESYLELLDYTHVPAFRVQAVHVFGALADLELRQGRLREAAGYWRKALKAIDQHHPRLVYPLPVTGWVYIRMGELLYEWNEKTGARDHLSRGLEHVELGGDVRAMMAGYLIAGRLELSEGNIEAAADYLERARALLEQAQFPHWSGRFDRLQLEVWLAQDRLRAAVNWSDKISQDGALADRPESETAQLAAVRVLIVKGDEPALRQGMTLLEQSAQRAESEGRNALLIEALALQALAHEKRGENTRALAALERALRLAEPEGYVRLFADLGLPMARLLQEVRSRKVMPDYVATLLSAFDGEISPLLPAKRPLPEPLTAREAEILALLAAGLTNQEIAAELIVSPLTVKKHASNIYSKMGVSGRTEAGAKARELGLLD